MGILHKDRSKSHTTSQSFNPAIEILRAAKQPKNSTAFDPIHDISQRPQFSGLSGELEMVSSRVAIQAKMMLGEANDRYEQEADRVAAQVVQQLNAPSVERSPTANLVGRSLKEYFHVSDLQMKPLPTLPQQEAIDMGENLQMPRSQSGAIVSGNVSNGLETIINHTKGSGKPLEPNLQQQMGQVMGADFCGVKVHTDSTADRWNRSIQAKAFTAGKNIFFKKGEYQPESHRGQELIAYELAHVVQQGFIPKTIQRQGDGDEDKAKEQKAENKREIPKTLEGLACSLESVVEICDKNDIKLLEVLKGPLEANWSLAKNCLLMHQWPIPVPWSTDGAGQRLMQALVDMRSRQWDAFARKTKPLIVNKVKQVAETRRSIFKTTSADLDASSDAKLDIGEAVGSQSVTSDVDLALKGDNTEIGVELINEEFRKEFNVPFDPGTVFDINVYSLDWMHGQTEVKEPQNDSIAIFKPEPEKRSQLSDLKAEQERDDRLEIWSLVKIRRNLTKVQWELFKSKIFMRISEARDIKAMQEKLLMADNEYQQFNNDVKMTLAAMIPGLEQQEARQLGYQKLNNEEKAYLRQALGRSYVEYQDEHRPEAQVMRASNKIYQDIILQVRDLRLQLDNFHKLPQQTPSNQQIIVKLSNQLNDKIAVALTYANEVYATEGAVLHTVYGKQGAAKKLEKLRIGDSANNIPSRPNLTAVKFNLTPQHYLQSVNENVGDALHSLNHYRKQPAYAVYRAGKYLERLCEAADYLLGQSARNVPQYHNLHQIGREAVRAKSGVVGQDPMEVYRDPFFSEFINDKDLGELKNQIIAFGAQVSATFYSKGAMQTTKQRSAQDVSPRISSLKAIFSKT